ncbi:hypothetical protein DICPUDRAFT_77781 [Dictyostelium purpureum]|uniref:Uncharacterized protein n=1 Tax=Dictyostelium purpureum TaxID=5786 RepID=F0ZHL3_DICPU|nr:uncharacterized protein DICPUDRAFT_77781 [Dictyostelium purpureum]EGC36551.1 hypothetical protein DICPUDRAFT_77781 [Dictyostelium purpureum]|eukprot:XP_003286923.1 hypothetical protein DICPUDRAFT_77781 [Dictyostelium purpureum]
MTYKNLKAVYPLTCNSEKCVMELDEDQIKNFYGNSINKCMDIKNKDLCNQPVDLTNFMYPINYVLSGLPSTEGGKLQLTANLSNRISTPEEIEHLTAIKIQQIYQYNTQEQEREQLNDLQQIRQQIPLQQQIQQQHVLTILVILTIPTIQ